MEYIALSALDWDCHLEEYLIGKIPDTRDISGYRTDVERNND